MASDNDLAASGHIHDFPDDAAIRDFVKSLGKPDDVMRRAEIPTGTFNKWMLDQPTAMRASSLLRIVYANDALDQFVLWLRKRVFVREPKHPPAIKVKSRPAVPAAKRAGGRGA
jgi:hypothetical protein